MAGPFSSVIAPGGVIISLVAGGAIVGDMGAICEDIGGDMGVWDIGGDIGV
ncbi:MULTISPECIES: hypothetical protein [Gordonia]|uniref:hypothetical protein n=1 Tax=Gordonia TaxID=2053 RepID=UPI0012E85578|nr:MULTISPECIES: hypothetical protein [Gordonia]